jgi:hypothetical protein
MTKAKAKAVEVETVEVEAVEAVEVEAVEAITFERVDEVPARTRKRTSVLNMYLDEFLRDTSAPLKVSIAGRDPKSTAIGLINLVKSRGVAVKVIQRQGAVYITTKS